MNDILSKYFIVESKFPTLHSLFIMCLIKNYNLMDGCYVCNDKEKQYSIAE